MAKLIELNESNNNTKIKAAKEDKINLVLKTNPSTGYIWESTDISAGTLDRIQHDPVILPLIMGASINIKFTFTVKRNGHFSFDYAQPWDHKTPPAKMFDVEIEIE